MKGDHRALLAGASLSLATLVVYANTFTGPPLFDDEPSILDNPSIRHLASALSPPRDYGLTVSGRPLLNLTLALNYAISGTDVWSYHVGNLLIHVLAGLTLFGLVRRTFELGAVGGALRPDGLSAHAQNRGVKPLLQQDALAVAFLIALLWLLHPLQTEAVTYVIQRAESLMGLLYLLTLYCFVRAVDAPRPVWWQAAAVAACALGMACKEVMVTAPVVVFLYDRTFAAGSFAEAWRRRRWFYVCLLLTWVPLAWLVASLGGDRAGTFTLTPGSLSGYWLSQFEAVARYVRLSFWPSPLIFEYGFSLPTGLGAVAPQAVAVTALLGATLWALGKRPVAGFLGACFFLILSPTSVVPSTVQTIVEHRMYLPLAAVLALAVGAVVLGLGRRGLVLLAVLAVGVGWLTARRNALYQDELALWSDTIGKRPGSAAAQNNLGRVYLMRGQVAEAKVHLAEAVHLNPGLAQPYLNLGLALESTGEMEPALRAYREAVRILPYFAQALVREGMVLNQLGRPAEAVEPLQAAARLLVDPADALFTLGQAESALGRWPEAADSYTRALRARPEHAEAHLNLGILLAQAGRLDEALGHLREAARLQPRRPEAHANLGVALAQAGHLAEAMASYGTALRLRPDYAEAHYNLGNALLQFGRLSEAKRQFAEALRLQPGMDAAREMLDHLRSVP